MTFPRSKNREPAFTLIELLTVIGIIAILAALLLPALNRAQLRGKRIVCENNLREMGIAFHVFAHDHNSKFPMAVPVVDGGSLEFIQNGYLVNGPFYFAFRHFQTLSNLLETPRILVCPTDQRLSAANFAALQNTNVSYFIGADADYFKPESILSGDGNLMPASTQTPSISSADASGRLQWNRDLHQFKGNVLFADGHVEEWGNAASGKNIAIAEKLILPTVNPPAGQPTSSTAANAGNNSGNPPAASPPTTPARPAQPSTAPSSPPAGPALNPPANPVNSPMIAPPDASKKPLPLSPQPVDPATLPQNSLNARAGQSIVQSNVTASNLPAIKPDTLVTNELPPPPATPQPKGKRWQNIVGWSFLLLLLLLLLLLFLAYQSWRNSRQPARKSPRR